jgi:hypothetical protein
MVAEQDLQEQDRIKTPPAKVRTTCMAAVHFAPDALKQKDSVSAVDPRLDGSDLDIDRAQGSGFIVYELTKKDTLSFAVGPRSYHLGLVCRD